ncbi:MAG: glycosyltransferase, partial [Gammaproteobacteria bacterium]|nr:glycosyltransferase [Gammaproteobacteria bacterium]
MKLEKENISVFSDRILIFIATYNEINNIGLLLEKIDLVIPNAHILVVDDNSPDGTGHLLEEISLKNKNLTVI